MKRLEKIGAVLFSMVALSALAPPDNSPRFTAIQIAENSSVSLALSGEPTTSYNIEATEDLTSTFVTIGPANTAAVDSCDM